MGKYSNFTKRSLSLALTVVMIFSVMNVGAWLSVTADDEDEAIVKSVGVIVAENYDDLTEAEKALIGSGDLVSEIVSFVKPGADDVDINVDIDTKLVTVGGYTDGTHTWTPVSADIVANGVTVETVEFTDDKATYTYGGDAFSVDVKYQMDIEVDEKIQSNLLNAPAYLKQGIANLDDIKAADGDLAAIAYAISLDEITMLVDGIKVQVPVGTQLVTLSAGFGVEAADAIRALRAEMAANGDNKLDLNVVADNYNGVEYLAANGVSAKKELVETYDLVTAVTNDKIFDNDLVAGMYPDVYTSLQTLKGVLENWLVAVEGAYADSWDINSSPVLTGATYKELDSLVADLGDDLAGVNVEVKNPLVVDETVIRYNMSMYDVSVMVVLNMVDGDGGLKPAEILTGSVTLAEGATAEEIYAAVEALGLTEAIKNNGEYVAEHYEKTATAIPETLTEDIEYVVTYSPKLYEVVFEYDQEASKGYYYGDTILLPKHADATKAYDYSVNGVYAAEGSIVKVEGAMTIDRAEGKSYTASDLYQIVSDNYLTGGGKGDKILTSGAIRGNEAVNVRYPSQEDKANLVKIENGTLYASKYPSSYNGLEWVPYSYTIVTGGVAGEEQLFNGATEVAMPDASYDRVDVTYALDLSSVHSDSKVVDILTLVDTLSEEAAAQKSALDTFANYADQMGQVNKTMLNMVKGGLENDELVAVIDNIINNNMSASGNFKLYEYIVGYKNDGLKYYYENSDAIISEIASLSENLGVMLDGGKNQADIVALLGSLGYAEYIEKLETLESKVAEVKENLTAPNAAIDLESKKLGDLADALAMAGDVEDWTVSESLKLTFGKYTLDSDQKHTVTFVVNGKEVYVHTFDRVDVLTEQVIEEMIAAVEAELGNYDSKFYDNNFKPEEFRQIVGNPVNVISNVEVSVTEKEFTVKVEGAEDQTITASGLKVTLPISPDAAYRYDYYLGGVKLEGSSYTFTLEEVAAGNLNITREVVYVEIENLTNFVNKLNESGNGAIEFALVENDGEFTIVMKLNTLEMNELMGAVQGVAMTMVMGGYGYVGLGGNAFVSDAGISLQTVIDVVMNSGFGKDTILAVMDENGVINNMTLEGEIISNDAPATLGGELVPSTMELGNNAENAKSYKLYITLGASNDMMLQLRGLLAGTVGNYVDVECDDDAANLILTMPGKAYEAYLAVLLATGAVDLSDLNAVNAEVAIGFFKDIIDPALSGEVTLKTFSNTLKKFGYNLDLASYEDLYEMFCKFYGNCNFSYDKTTGIVDTNVSIKSFIDSMNLGELGSMIVEYETGIDLTATLKLTNLATEYDALYIDVKADGVTNKAGLTTNIAKKDLSGAAVVVLLDNVTGDLVFDSTTILNLNGYTVDGDIVANGKVIIIDAGRAPKAVGTVTGDVSGDAYILGGKYEDVVTDYLKSSYIQNADGEVQNYYFNIVRDAEGNITVELNADLLTPSTAPDVKAVIIDVATEILFAEYNNNSFYVDGNLVYDLTVNDIVDLVTGGDRLEKIVYRLAEMFNSADLGNIINTVIADLTAFGDIEAAILADKPIFSYEIETGAWGVATEHVKNGNYLTLSLISGNKLTRTLDVVVVGTDADKKAVADIYGELAATTDIDASVDMKDGWSADDDKNFFLDYSAAAKAEFDFSSPAYTLLINIMIADGLGAPANEALVAGIEEYFETGSYTKLKAAFDKLTVNQVIKALENTPKSYDVEASLAALGITGVTADEIAELESIYDPIVEVLCGVLRKLDIDRGSRTLGSFLMGVNSYGFSKTHIEASYDSKEFYKGFSFTLNGAIDEVTVLVNLFGDELTPELGAPVFGEHDKVANIYVDGGFIYVDAHVNGINAAELESIIDFVPNTVNANSVTFDIDANGIVCNGATLYVKAVNGKQFDEATYTIIVLGDVNGNGRNESGDAAYIAKNLVALVELDEAAALAADFNGNGRVDIGDANLIAQKYISDWESYKTSVEEAE